MASEDSKSEMIARIVAAYAARSDVSAAEIVDLFGKLAREAEIEAPVSLVQADKPRPALPLDRAITDDKVFCLVCGRGFKMLKRHLGAEHGMTEADYRAAFDLPEDLALVAPSYSRKKAAYAKKAGFGKYARTVRREDAKSR
jgi:predicted transcriptional regulator